MFVHLYPVEVEDLPAHRVEYGFDNPDFQGNRLAGGGRRCVRVVRLLEYETARLATGEYNERSPLWRETGRVSEEDCRRWRLSGGESPNGPGRDFSEPGTPLNGVLLCRVSHPTIRRGARMVGATDHHIAGQLPVHYRVLTDG